MKFRHPGSVRLALTSGHVTIVGPKWVELQPMFHLEALSKGCECDQTTIRTQPVEPPKASDNAVKNFEEASAIRAALIAMVERNAEDDFTAGGTPNLKTLAKQTGFKVDKTQALEVWHQLEAEAQAEADAEAAEKAQAEADAAGNNSTEGAE